MGASLCDYTAHCLAVNCCASWPTAYKVISVVCRANHHKAKKWCDAVVPLAFTLYLYGQQTKSLMPTKTFVLWSKLLPILYSLFSSKSLLVSGANHVVIRTVDVSLVATSC